MQAENFENFENSENLNFDGVILSKAYKVLNEKTQKSWRCLMILNPLMHNVPKWSGTLKILQQILVQEH